MQNEYVEERNGGYYVAGTRISLDSVVIAFNRGDSPETILENFPLLSKSSKVYGAIAFYLDHQAEIDAYLEVSKNQFAASVGPPLSETNPALWKRLQQARTQAAASDSSDTGS